jgi:putative FmdB family regulatory protein
MPLYEYECESCAKRFERIQKFSDPPADTCPSCGGAVRKLLSSPAIQFKGSGWYITDYARKGKDGGSGTKKDGTDSKDSKDSKEAPASSSDSSSSSTSPSTPATTPTTKSE